MGATGAVVSAGVLLAGVGGFAGRGEKTLLASLLADVIAGGTGGSSGAGRAASEGRTIFDPELGEVVLLIDVLVEEERLDLVSIDETPPGTGVICAHVTELKVSRL